MKPRRSELVTFLMTGMVAAALVTLVYFSISSLPFLSISPATDLNFGTQNEQLLKLVSERVGFAVSPDATLVAAWSTKSITVCEKNGRLFTQPLNGISLGVFDFRNRLWLFVGGVNSELLLIDENQKTKSMGTMSVISMVRTHQGIALLQSSGHLLSLDFEGTVLATEVFQSASETTLSSSVDGQFVALVKPPFHTIIESASLRRRNGAPCEVSAISWARRPGVLVARCAGSDPLILECNATTAVCEAVEKSRTPKGTPISEALSIEPCDGLPCSVGL